jgi:anti-anti-sigma factor
MEIETTSQDGVTLVVLRGPIVDGKAAEQLHRELRTLIAEKKIDTIFDLSGVEWFDSVAIGLLVCHYISTTQMNGKIVILQANDKIKKLLKMVKLEDRFEWAEHMDQALAAFRK